MKLKLRYKLYYGIGNLGYSVVSQTITNFFMFFGTSVLKIPGSLVGLAVALGTIWDAVTDPFVGYISDNKKLGFFGYRNGYILIGVIGITIVNLLIWCVPIRLNNLIKFIWVAVSLVLMETFCTLFSTPYGALSSDLVSEYNDRTQIQIYKTIFFLLGMIIPSVLLNLFLPSTPEYPQGQLNPLGYRNIALFCSVVMLICGLICVFGTLKISKEKKSESANTKTSYKQLFSEFVNCLKNPHQRIIVFGYSLSMISGAILTSVGMHFFTYCFKYDSIKITVILTTLLISMAVSQPYWYNKTLKEDKKPALISGLLLAIVGVIVIMLVYIFKALLIKTSFFIMIFAIFIVGFGVGTLYSLPISMYLDVIAYVNKNEDKNIAGTSLSFLTFSYNITNASAQLIIGILLDLIKFNPDLPLQTRPVQTGIATILFVGVLISLISSFVLFSTYKLKKRDFEDCEQDKQKC